MLAQPPPPPARYACYVLSVSILSFFHFAGSCMQEKEYDVGKRCSFSFCFPYFSCRTWHTGVFAASGDGYFPIVSLADAARNRARRRRKLTYQRSSQPSEYLLCFFVDGFIATPRWFSLLQDGLCFVTLMLLIHYLRSLVLRLLVISSICFRPCSWPPYVAKLVLLLRSLRLYALSDFAFWWFQFFFFCFRPFS